MPARKKPTSTRQKKADVQLKRAIKRGDIPAPSPDTKKQHLKARRRGPTGNLIGSSASDPAIQAARRLQSAFITLPPNFLEETKQLASTLPLPRPIPADAVIFVHPDANGALSCPRRPKWRFDMSKKEVEHNEEGVFKKWLEDTDGVINKWQNHKENNSDLSGGDHSTVESSTMPRSPTFFERNLEVWRQLWRVTEISQILLVLVDSRCPLLHFPPSLASYLSGRKVILVLTKVDLCGPVRAEAWTNYFHEHYPHLRVVQVESYVEKSSSLLQGHKHYEPHLPITFRERLVGEIKAVHAEMLQPPDKVKANPKWLQQWQPTIKRDIDWAGVMDAGGSVVGSIVNEATYARKSNEEEEEDAMDASTTTQEPEFLTIGLIGQPNVGKSSLLNALFGTSRVRASKTPGKTKHFQTLFWTPDVRLVDCPGLVMPSFIPMEMQVLSGILPISRVSAVPSCTHYACQFLPLERIYNLAHPILALPEVKDKRTWRAGEGTRTETKQTNLTWTAMDVLVAFADVKGWVTAKAGRPDIHRAGNAILRALAEGRIRWAFWPPGTTIEEVRKEQETDNGIWIAGDSVVGDDTEEESEPDDRDKGVSEDSGEDQLTAGGDNAYDSDASEKGDMSREVGTRFEVLGLDDVEEDIDDDEDNGDETS